MIDRRQVLTAAGATGLMAAGGCASLAAIGSPRQTVWRFDRLETLPELTIEGAPERIDGPGGGAMRFDGIDDALFIGAHPLAGASTFTFEAIFRPDGGAVEQRWMHLAEDEPVVPGQSSSVSAPVGTRFLFEIRVHGDRWALDAFTKGPGYNHTLLFPDRLHPVGRWTHVAQTFDGTMYRSFVDGELQGEAPIAFRPQGPGRASVGCRINRVNYFNGAIAEARFTHAALSHDRFTRTGL